jgi:hypothetical protein
MELYPYRESKQFEKYISQFARIFKGFQYDSGDGVIKRIPVVYGSMDRIVAGILSKNDVHQNNRLPIMAVNMTGINMDTTGRRPKHHIDSVPNIADPDTSTRKVSNRLIAPAFIMDMELSIYASSTVELFNIVEQILLIFNPRITIKVDTNASSGNYLTEVMLESIQNEIQYPMGAEKRIIQLGMTFSVPVRLNYPHDLQDTIIRQIHTNVIDDNNDESIVEDVIE